MARNFSQKVWEQAGQRNLQHSMASLARGLERCTDHNKAEVQAVKQNLQKRTQQEHWSTVRFDYRQNLRHGIRSWKVWSGELRHLATCAAQLLLPTKLLIAKVWGQDMQGIRQSGCIEYTRCESRLDNKICSAMGLVGQQAFGGVHQW